MIGNFIHVFWGEENASFRRRGGSRWSKAIRDLAAASKRGLIPGAVVYCYGLENSRALKELGYSVRLVSEEAVVFPEDQFWRHKVDGWLHAMDDLRKPIIYVDMDVRQEQPLPADLWEKMAERDTLQAVVEQFRGIKVHFRKFDQRKVNSGKFVYLGDIQAAIAVDAQFNSRDHSRRSWDETAITATIMDRLGGWEDDSGAALRRCIVNHEPYCAVSRRIGCWRWWPEYAESKQQIFKFPPGNT